MKLLYLLFLLTFEAQAENIEVEGEISIKLKDPSQPRLYKTRMKEKEGDNKDYKETRLLSEENALGFENARSTAGSVVECMYEIPEESQAQALLSNMMNELTKMFVRAHEIMNEDYRRRGETRFRVIPKKQTDFFEGIYDNMTREYLKFYNSTAIRVDRSGKRKDPCENQKEMKELWKDLLESSLTTFRQAAFRCVNEQLKAAGDLENSKIRQKMSQYLLRELGKIKMSQLEVLCDQFQLCYNELVRRHKSHALFSSPKLYMN